ncbi:MAG: polyamine aminopropyltransferase, partial [Dichotomicrobium sp.]
MTRWIPETLHEHFRFSFQTNNVLYESQTEHQHLVIFENTTFGRVLMLDGVVQLTEEDEFVYHEMMAHVPLMALAEPKRVLIIGGGDGGVLREVLRHDSVERAVLCEIDESVIDLSKRYLDFVAKGAFDDPRAEVVIADGTKYVAETDERFEAILVDSTDPIGPATALFTRDFYTDCKAALAEGGVLIAQSGLPFLQGDELRDVQKSFRALFADAAAYLMTTPTYIGGPMALSWGCDDPARRTPPLDTLKQRAARLKGGMKYYTPEVHLAAFALPAYVAQ